MPESGWALNAALQLHAWVRSHNWIGYDPYDLRAAPQLLPLLQSPLLSRPTKAVTMLFPGTMRRLFGIQPAAHPKAMALFALAYLDLYEVTGDAGWLEFARERLAWLQDNALPGFHGRAWGLPSTYYGRDTIPAGTPSTVITCIAANAFLRAATVLDHSEYLDEAARVCTFLVKDVPRSTPDDHRVCFSKVTAAKWHIHNANIFVAATLARVGKATGTRAWDRLARQAVRYTISEQRYDGAWYYWAPPDRMLHWIDHYHTGFILRGLDDLLKTTGWEELYLPLQRGYQFYTRRLFRDRYIPRFTEKRAYPVDIHACAEAILALSQLSTRFPNALDMAAASARWTLAHMRHSKGYFYYRQYPMLKVKFPFMRWGQAWMLAALSHLALANAKKGKIDLTLNHSTQAEG